VEASEPCPGDTSLVAAGNLDQFPGSPDSGSSGQEESDPICVEVSEPCPGDTSLIAAGNLNEFPQAG
jgi:hypothetical protein